ncbi:pentatricopeptide repeat-containing protein At4g25270, chloroplastic-like [Papaver somniferum]|uniref:pentatricopeptide repeat-containing protein At4g25270, chloroplastic-like n=1 Tax=Papaver somniferum TaxID=3469 RepID=UPI000E6F565B|nr:pentatricopeptide repeat-containing protein At4g25270, chloroplastic-like [Papaver somniferum]
MDSIQVCTNLLFHSASSFSMATIHNDVRSFHLCNSIRERRKKEQKRIDRRKKQHLTIVPPTPLIHHQTPYTQTKHQALDEVLKEIKNSIKRGIHIDTQIFSSLLETCFQLESVNHGIQIHHLIPADVLRKSVSLSSKLLRLYASCGLVDSAHQLFDEMPKSNTSAFPWNSLISGYAELGRYEDAMALYFQMEEENVEPDQFTFPRVLKACAGIGSIRIGEAIHRDVVRFGFGYDGFVLNALVDMYAKCGDIVKARKIFGKIKQRDSVSWNSILTGYVRHGLLDDAVGILREMLLNGFQPDSVTISSILAGFPLSKLAGEIHGWVLRRGFENNLSIANSLIGVYSNQGKLDRAWWLFKMMPEKDVVSWNSIITGHHKCQEALTYFHEMEKSGVVPDNITFVSLLSACAHLGLVEDGRILFAKMKDKYRIKAQMEHYACMVNLLGRAGLIVEAYDVIVKEMEFEAGSTVWGALLFACSVHGNAEVGEIAANKLFDLEPDNAHNFELLMKIYGGAGRWEEMEKVMRVMVDRGLDSID